MDKQYLAIFGLGLMLLIPTQIVQSEANSEVEEMYFTTEDIISDIIFPTIDKRVIEEYKGDNFLDWQWKRIEGITYHEGHFYDVTVRIEIPPETPNDETKEDLVKVRIFPPCDSEKINQQKCAHGFKIELLDYKQLSS